MLGEMKKLRSLLIMTSCVLLTGALFPGNLLAETVTEEWVATYNGPGNRTDDAFAMALDPSGNVYVTGESTGSGTSLDYATIKYDLSGNQLWVARYNGPGNGHDSTSAIAVDALGNVYVTGFCNIGSVDFDYATVKYDPFGTELWVARYDGPANMHDYAYAMDVDALGNVYVTGRSCSSESNFDYATVKYDTNGNELWVARYDPSGYAADEAYAIAVDALGNVYVTGHSWNLSSNLDYATIKYDSSGHELWVARYNDPENRSDSATAMVLDTSGNVYVTGKSYSSGTIYDYATLKYDTNGNQLWVARYDGAANNDMAYAIAVDISGNVYVTGESCGSGTSYDYATVKYDTNGSPLWIARYNGPVNGFDSAYAMALDPEGNVYVTGESYGSDTKYDCATLKYDSSGNELWVTRYDGPTSGSDCALAMALDALSNVYVTGYRDGYGYSGYITVKYSQHASPVDLLLQLAQDVIQLNLQNGIENSLDVKLDAALQAMEDINESNDVAAINTLEAFIAAVEAQSDNKIPEADANDLIAAALEIIAILSSE